MNTTIRSALLITVFTAAPLIAKGVTQSQLGDSAYNKSSYVEALQHYNSSLEREGVSSELYYNIGNTYYRLGNVGQAVLSYERALRLNPANDDARANLQFVYERIQDRPEDNSSFLDVLQQRIVSAMSPDSWALTALVMFILVAGAAALYLFGTNVMLRKVGFFGGLVLLFCFAYDLYIAWQAASGSHYDGAAVVTAAGATLRSMPSSASKADNNSVPVPVGTRVVVLDSLATPQDSHSSLWYNVKINNTSRAWISASDVERV